MGPAEWLLLGLLSLIWGWSFFLHEVALVSLPVPTVVVGRITIGALALVGLVKLSGQSLPGSLRAWWPYLVMGLLNNLIPFSLLVWGQTKIDGGLAAIMIAATPVFTVLLGHFLTADERLTAPRLTGVLIGLIGVAVIIGPAVWSGGGGSGIGEAACLGAALCYALAGIFGRRFRSDRPLVSAAAQLVVSTVLGWPVLLIIQPPWAVTGAGWLAWGSVIGLGLFCTAAAYVIYFRILASSGATNVLLVTLMVPVSAILLGVGLGDEVIALHQVAGMGVIALALLIIDGRLVKRLRGSRSDRGSKTG